MASRATGKEQTIFNDPLVIAQNEEIMVYKVLGKALAQRCVRNVYYRLRVLKVQL